MANLNDGSPGAARQCPACGSSIDLAGVETSVAGPPSPRTFGRFELRERVGSGAFGYVWKAHDPELHRMVAVKVPRKGELLAEEAELFLREARAAAQLRHPHIVAVHEVGREGSTVYIVSDFIPGSTLAQRISGRPMSAREAAELCASIAEALHHAHEAGVIHRDLKPSNILIDESDQPLVTDFGLAKRDGGGKAQTQDGRVIGTPAYMAPEQAQGKSREADRRADVYALGVILYELLTGRKPFEGAVPEILRQVVDDEPRPPRSLNHKVPVDLETVCLKCMEKDRNKRYTTAADVARELKRFMQGEPVQARRVGALTRCWRRCRRNPALTASFAAILLLVAGMAWMVGAGNSERSLPVADIPAETSEAAESTEPIEREVPQERVSVIDFPHGWTIDSAIVNNGDSLGFGGTDRGQHAATCALPAVAGDFTLSIRHTIAGAGELHVDLMSGTHQIRLDLNVGRIQFQGQDRRIERGERSIIFTRSGSQAIVAGPGFGSVPFELGDAFGEAVFDEIQLTFQAGKNSSVSVDTVEVILLD